MAENTGDLLQSAARALRRRYGAAMAQWDIAPSQARALRFVCELESPRLSHLADRLRIAPRSATEVVDALEQRGLVTRMSDPTDRRATCLVATAAGHELCERIDGARVAEAEDYLSVLPAADRAALHRVLTRLTDTAH